MNAPLGLTAADKKIRLLAASGYFLNALLYAGYYVVAKSAIEKSDPWIFSTLDLSCTLPVSTYLIYRHRTAFHRKLVLDGMKLGANYYVVVMLGVLALQSTTATETAFFPALNTLMAAIAIKLFKKNESISCATWVASGIAALGVGVIFPVMHRHWQGNLFALASAGAHAGYNFLTEKITKQYEVPESSSEDSETGSDSETAPLMRKISTDFEQPLLAVEWATATGLFWLSLGLYKGAAHQTLDITPYGHWEMLLYVLGSSILTTMLPTAIATFAQPKVSLLTSAMGESFEPIFTAILAYLVLREELPWSAYLAAAAILVGSGIQIYVDAKEESQRTMPHELSMVVNDHNNNGGDSSHHVQGSMGYGSGRA